jgi:hypothetical protein
MGSFLEHPPVLREVEPQQPPCIEWQFIMEQLVLDGKWDQLQPKPPCPCGYCFYCRVAFRPLRPLLLEEHLFTDEMLQAVHQLYGELPPEEWTHILSAEPFRVPVLRYLLHHKLIHPDIASPTTLLTAGIIHHSQEVVDFLLSREVGISIDLPDVDGNTSLHTLLDISFKTGVEGDDIPVRQSPSYHLLEFLLEQGADPLLPNRRGIIPMTYAERIRDPEKRDAVIALGPRYL